jgi:ubiquitin conjugation factor E4 B
VFSTHPLARDHLIASIVKLFVDAEQTGLSTQFYDKFNIRYHISQIMKNVWHDQYHRQKLIDESR